MPSVTASYVLAVEIGINVSLVAILKFLPITVPKLRLKESNEVTLTRKHLSSGSNSKN
jgi:hypothetical protein